jgi:hypothetical protein
MHDPHRAEVPERHEERTLSRGAPCLVCGEWIEAGAKDAYRVLVSNPPREGEYACHEACFEQIRNTAVPEPS